MRQVVYDIHSDVDFSAVMVYDIHNMIFFIDGFNRERNKYASEIAGNIVKKVLTLVVFFLIAGFVVEFFKMMAR